MNSDDPKITVATQVYSEDQKSDLEKCIKSLINQTYDDYEILVASESQSLTDFVESEYQNYVRSIYFENEYGVSVARNKAYKNSNGDIVVYIDSDAEADPKWLESIAKSYEDQDTIAVGGRAKPDWNSSRPPYLPDEFLWLVGSTHQGHPDDEEMVRSTFGCNMSFRREVLEDLDGFNRDMGKDHGYNLQGEEPELGARMKQEFGTGMLYNEDAVVYHKVEEYQTSIRWLSKRAYLQGVTKAFIDSRLETNNNLNPEKNYSIHLLDTLMHYPKYMIFNRNKIAKVFELFGLLYFTFLVGIGYLVGKIKS